MQARRGDFDELERWGDRLRNGEVEINGNFVAEDFYDWLAEAYVSPSDGSRGLRDAFYQAQFAFVDGWLKQKPDSVAARIVKARSLVKYALDAHGGEFADKVPDRAWQQFRDRLEQAEQVLSEAAGLELARRLRLFFAARHRHGARPAAGRAGSNARGGLQISKKDFTLIDCMTNALLPRWGGQPGDLGKFASQMAERIGGDDGLDAYGRIAMLTQTAEVSLERGSRKKKAPAESAGYTDPNVVLTEFSADKLRAAIPVLHRHAKVTRAMNYACWLACVVDDRETAKQLFADILEKPNLAVWGSRDRFDYWHRWSDPSVAEPSKFLPIEGKEIAHLQAYADGAAELDFLLDNQTLITGSTSPATAIKLWNLGQQKIVRQFDLLEGYGNLAHLRILADGVLFVPMRNGKLSVSVEYYRAPRPTTPSVFAGMAMLPPARHSSTACIST